MFGRDEDFAAPLIEPLNSDSAPAPPAFKNVLLRIVLYSLLEFGHPYGFLNRIDAHDQQLLPLRLPLVYELQGHIVSRLLGPFMHAFGEHLRRRFHFRLAEYVLCVWLSAPPVI